MAIFDRFKKPIPKSELYYEEEPQSLVKRFTKFSIFVVIALLTIVLIIATVFFVNFNNNSLNMMWKSSVKSFDCGSFDFKLSTSIDGVTYMAYDGQFELDLNKQSIESVYHAVYEDYEYDAVVYAKGNEAYRGNYYGGKWSTESYIDSALDFFDFYRDYRKGEFDAGAAVRFTKTNSKFNAQQLKCSVENILSELSKPANLNSILHQEIISSKGATTVTFTPQLDKVSDVIVSNIGSAYTSANSFNELKKSIDNSRENLESAYMTFTYVINANGYLTDVNIDYVIADKTYEIDINMSNFKQADAIVPNDFLIAAGIEN